MKTMIAVPCMDDVPYRFVESLIALRPVGEVTIQFLSGSLVYEARNQLLIKAIGGEYDYIFWLDSDMVFNEDLLERMFESIGDGDFLSGLYYTRRAVPLKPTLFSKAEYVEQNGIMIPDSDWVRDIPTDRNFEIAAAGFGCVLMKTELGHTVLNKCGLPFTPLFGFGEDLSFCIRARKLGYTLMADGRIQPGHMGRFVVDADFVRLNNEDKTY